MFLHHGRFGPLKEKDNADCVRFLFFFNNGTKPSGPCRHAVSPVLVAGINFSIVNSGDESGSRKEAATGRGFHLAILFL